LKKIYLVRHCSAAGQHKDSPLSTEGTRQAQLLSIFFSDQNYSIDKIYSSPYLRAIESIKPYAENIDLKINIDDRLRERVLSNEPVDDWLEVLEQSFDDHDYSLPGGESANEATYRVNQLLNEIYESDDSNIILVTHGNLFALILRQFDDSFGFNQWKEIQNPDVYLITYDKTVQSIKSLWKNQR
jgi:2,3-bisphosphoglycerate-dependent phosphoglycerate mutase